MFLTNGMKATLRKFNRSTNNSLYDDKNSTESYIYLCPYAVAQGIKFSIYSHPEATGYYIVKRTDDVREGDQIIFLNGYTEADDIKNQTHTVLKVSDNWIFNRVENKVIAIK